MEGSTQEFQRLDINPSREFMGSDGKEFACSVGDLGPIPGLEDPLEKGMATHFSILAWGIPWAEKPGELQRSPWGCKEPDMAE